MTSWLRRTQAGIQSAPTTPAVSSIPGYIPTKAARVVDPNAPDSRLDIESRCIYERRLPGNAYITAHVTRLQDGFYDSPDTHGDCVNNVRFLAVSFVFHPCENVNRFQAATVTIGIHDDTDQAFTDPTPGCKVLQEPRNKPKFLRFAPHVLFGGVSPETLDWNFNLTGSLGVSQTPASASISPTAGVKGSYKLYQMMRIQGSTRTLLRRNHHEYDIEDGEVCWTMEENNLQRSGLPREMTFVMLITKGDVENVVFDIKIHPKVASWYGHYPKWWSNAPKYRPLSKEHTDLDTELGQKFEPIVPGKGFNFANLAGTFNDFVSLPGTTYSLSDHAFSSQLPESDTKDAPNASSKNAKPSAKQSTQNAQPTQAVKQIQPPARSQTVPPPSNLEAHEAPMDYHIYLHNPRTINLHATPPPQLSTSPPVQSAIRPQARSQPQSYTDQPTVNIIRPKSTAPSSSYHHSQSQQRISSPANTGMKRRSIDITNLKKGVNSDESRRTQSSSHRHDSERDRSTSGGSLRRRRSNTNLRNEPVPEEQSRSRSQIDELGSGSVSTSDSLSRSSKLSLARSRSASNPSSPKSMIIEAPSPPDPGLSGFKARLQAHMASERERERDRAPTRTYTGQDQSRNRERERARPAPTQRNRLPFEVQSAPHRPPREMTPSPDPTENPNSETTQDDIIADQDELIDMGETPSRPARPTTAVKLKPEPNTYFNLKSPAIIDASTSTPHRRERQLPLSPPPVPVPVSVPISGPTIAPYTNGTTTSTAKSPPSASFPFPSTSKSPSSPGARPLSPYASPKPTNSQPQFSSFRLVSAPGPRARRESSASLSPDEVRPAIEDEQPAWGDLKEEARRKERQRKRMSLPAGGIGGVSAARSPNGAGAQLGDRVAYEYITEADGEWEDR